MNVSFLFVSSIQVGEALEKYSVNMQILYKKFIYKAKEESQKASLKLIQKTMIMVSSIITSWEVGKQWKQ